MSISDCCIRIWSTLKKPEDSVLPYSPPYQEWLKTLLPAMQILDPWQKPGEEYTFFEPPFKVQRRRQPQKRQFSDHNDLERDFDDLYRQKINKIQGYNRTEYSNSYDKNDLYKNDY